MIDRRKLAELGARADAALRDGSIDQAIAAHRDLLRADPGLPDAWFNLAWLQRKARRFEDALESYSQALAQGARGREEIHLNRAAIFSEHLERIDDADAELHKAIAANPQFVPAWLNLGNLHEDRGNASAAREAYSKALAVDPRNGRAHARLAAIAVFEGKPTEALEPLRRALEEPGLGQEDRAEISFALGNALDACGHYRAAFDAFAEGNQLRRSMSPLRYNRKTAEDLIDSIIAAFPETRAQEQSDGAAPIFICGMFRSGSTLAEQILARHSAVTAAGELEFIPAIVAERLQPFPEAAARLTPFEARRLREDYLEQLSALHPLAERITDKRPDNFLYIGMIKAIFPEAKVVHTMRNPLDNLLSIYFLDFEDSVTYGHDLGDAAHWYVQYRRLMAHWQRLYPADIHDFDYDRTVRDPEPEIRALLDFCELEWEDSVLKPRESTTVRTASVWQVRQPLHTRSSGRARNYEAYLGQARTLLNLPAASSP